MENRVTTQQPSILRILGERLAVDKPVGKPKRDRKVCSTREMAETLMVQPPLQTVVGAAKPHCSARAASRVWLIQDRWGSSDQGARLRPTSGSSVEGGDYPSRPSSSVHTLIDRRAFALTTTFGGGAAANCPRLVVNGIEGEKVRNPTDGGHRFRLIAGSQTD